MNKKVENKFNEMCTAIRSYKRTINEELKARAKELPLDNGYGEDEPLVINTLDDDLCAITYELDKARYNEERGYVEFHAVAINYDETDEWIPCYYLGSEETYAFENIKWE